MTPHVRVPRNASIETENTSEVTFSIWLPRSTTGPRFLKESLSQLEQELRQCWPVSTVRDSCRRRNPASLTQIEVSLVVGLSAPLVKSLANKLCDEASNWLKKRFLHSDGSGHIFHFETFFNQHDALTLGIYRRARSVIGAVS